MSLRGSVGNAPYAMIHKFVDDTTLSEIIAKSGTSYMQERCNELVEHSQEARMIVNDRKTKEMIIGPILKDPPPDLLLNDAVVDRVSTFKLLGVYVSNDLKWTEHFRTVTTKVSSRLHFLKQLKRTGCAEGDLPHICCATNIGICMSSVAHRINSCAVGRT